MVILLMGYTYQDMMGCLSNALAGALVEGPCHGVTPAPPVDCLQRTTVKTR